MLAQQRARPDLFGSANQLGGDTGKFAQTLHSWRKRLETGGYENISAATPSPFHGDAIAHPIAIALVSQGHSINAGHVVGGIKRRRVISDRNEGIMDSTRIGSSGGAFR